MSSVARHGRFNTSVDIVFILSWTVFPGWKKHMVTIFIVDDEAILHRLYKDVFSIKGHEVVADAYDGAEAVDKFVVLEPKPEVIILDHRMPNKDGMQTMKEILEIDPKAKIVFISADANVREQAMGHGAASFGLKPVTIRHMLDLVESAVSD
jgi:two-component system chemotaxis response regulator CheY